jgi:hypothetical protein
MIREIKVVDVYGSIVEEVEVIAGVEEQSEQEEPPEEIKADPIEEAPEDEATEEPTEEPEEQPTIKTKNKRVLDMPTTNKILEQVECQACGSKMSAKNLKYSHSKYCTQRNQEQQPEEIPVPKIELKNDAKIKEKQSLPVKAQTQPKPVKSTRTHSEQEEPQQPAQQGAQKAEDWWKDTLHKKRERERHLSRYKNLFSKAY